MARTYFSVVKWITISAFFLGLLLILGGEAIDHYSSWKIIASIITHIGVSLIVASIIGFFLELSEIKDFFDKRLTDIIVESEFLIGLNESKLLNIIRRSILAISTVKIDNNNYEYDSFSKMVTDDILPHIGEVYLENYYVKIEINALNESHYIDLGLNDDDVKKPLIKVVYEVSFLMVSPKKTETQHGDYDIHWWVPRIPSLDVSKHFTLELTINGDKQETSDLTEFISEEKEDNRLTFNKSLKVNVEDIARIKYKLTAYEYGETGSMTYFLDHVTYYVSMHLVSNRPLDLDAEIFGILGNYSEPSISDYSVTLNYPGWMLPGHGYFITWHEK
jgi:hypothetical protein